MGVTIVGQEEEKWTLEQLKSMIRKEKEIRDKESGGVPFIMRLQGVPIDLLDKEELLTVIRVMQGPK